MNFNKHSELDGKHAFLSASKYHWINYSVEKLRDTYYNWMAAQKGVELHEFAKQCILLGVKLPHSRKTLNKYVNDAIGFKMEPEVILKYSDNCYGTADAISFRKNKLRIHDLKTGANTASMHQLEIYAALYCLEYHKNPFDIEIELRIYQNNDVGIVEPSGEWIKGIMDKIIEFDEELEKMKAEA